MVAFTLWRIPRISRRKIGSNGSTQWSTRFGSERTPVRRRNCKKLTRVARAPLPKPTVWRLLTRLLSADGKVSIQDVFSWTFSSPSPLCPHHHSILILPHTQSNNFVLY